MKYLISLFALFALYMPQSRALPVDQSLAHPENINLIKVNGVAMNDAGESVRVQVLLVQNEMALIVVPGETFARVVPSNTIKLYQVK